MRRVQILLALLVLALALVASACGSSNESSGTETTAAAGTQSTSADPCAKDQLELVNEGTLTIGTDNPAYPPWFGGTPAVWTVCLLFFQSLLFAGYAECITALQQGRVDAEGGGED